MLRLLAALCLCVALLGCDDGGEELVLYTSVDEPYARPIIDKFTEQTGIAVRLVTDTEANKSVGLAERLRLEKNRPVADVWWGNEPFHTVRLAREGAFASYEPTTAADTLPLYRGANNHWFGNGLRARVVAWPDFAANAGPDGAIPGVALPGSMEQIREFAQTDHYAIAIARPTAGTTGGHVAALYVLWGQERADAYFRALGQSGRVTVVAGNGPAARFVVDGGGEQDTAVSLTDNDDVANFNKSSDYKIEAWPLDQGEDEIGTLTIPTTVALVAKDQPSDAAKRLVDFLASAEAERMLADAEFTIGSVRQSPESGGIRAMDVDYDAVADAMPEAVRRATALLEGREP